LWQSYILLFSAVLQDYNYIFQEKNYKIDLKLNYVLDIMLLKHFIVAVSELFPALIFFIYAYVFLTLEIIVLKEKRFKAVFLRLDLSMLFEFCKRSRFVIHFS